MLYTLLGPSDYLWFLINTSHEILIITFIENFKKSAKCLSMFLSLFFFQA